MISIIIKSYLFILLAVATGALTVFGAGVFLILRKKSVTTTAVANAVTPTQEQVNPASVKCEHVEAVKRNVTSIAGDDVLATQLDLARAYIETGKNDLAKHILQLVTQQGSAAQQQEAQYLLSLI